MKSQRSAVVIIPPESVWEQIQKIRKVHDRAHHRWMPHINLLYPFYEGDDQFFRNAVRRMTIALSDLQPFIIRFTSESFGFFKHTNFSTFWLRPLTADILSHNEKLEEPEVTKSTTPHQNDDYMGLVKQTKQNKPPTRQVTEKSSSAVIRNRFRHPDVRGTAVGLDALSGAVWEPGDTDKSENKSVSGFDALRDAVWTSDSRYSPVARGLDALRDAIWRPGENTLQRETDISQQNVREDQIERRHWQVASSDGKLREQNTISVNISESESNSEDEETAEQEKQIESLETPNENQHLSFVSSTAVEQLQRKLLMSFPECDDVCRHQGEHSLSFRPHLTLGQLSGSVTLNNWKTSEEGRNWRDIEFMVSEIHIITRKGKIEPFQIRHTIKIGCDFGGTERLV